MVKLNRTTEYGLLALTYIRTRSTQDSSAVISAREIAQHYSLPFEILAKTLQKLKDIGIISSHYGTRGGYVLAQDLSTLNLAHFLHLLEGKSSGVVSCVHPSGKKEALDSKENCKCEYLSQCDIKATMLHLNEKVYKFLSEISIEELTRGENEVQKSFISASTFDLQGDEP